MLTLTPAQQDYHEEEIRAGGVGSLMVQDPALMKKTARMAARESHSGVFPGTLPPWWTSPGTPDGAGSPRAAGITTRSTWP